MQKKNWTKRFMSSGLVGILWLNTAVPIYAANGNVPTELQNAEVQAVTEKNKEFPFDDWIQEQQLQSMWVGDAISLSYSYRKNGYVCEAIENAENVDIKDGVIRFLKEGTVKLKVHKEGEADSEQLYNVNVLPAKEPYVEQLLPEKIKIGDSFEYLYKYHNSPIESEGALDRGRDFQVSNFTWGEHSKYFLQEINWGGADITDPDTRILQGFMPGCAVKPGVLKVAAERDIKNPYLVTIEKPVIKSNLPQTIAAGTTLNVTTALENTSLNNRKIEDVLKELKWNGEEPRPETKYPIGYQPQIVILSGAELVERSDQNYTHTLNTSETMKFIGEGTVKFKVTYDMHSFYKSIFKTYDGIHYSAPCLPVGILEEAMYSPEAIFTVNIKDEKKAPVAVTNLKGTSSGKQKVRLTWSASKGAEGYLIYAQKNGKYGYCGMTTKETSFVDKKALDTDYNYYWVFPYVKDVTGKMLPGKCKKYVYAKGIIPSVSNLKGASMTGGVRVSWTKRSDADGYLVYGIRDGQKYGYIGMTSGSSFIDKKASKKGYNFYWVFPFHYSKDGKIVVGEITPKYVYGKAN